MTVPGPAERLLARLSTSEKRQLLSGSTPFWSGMADIALHDASHRHPWPAGEIPRLGLEGLHFVDGPRGVVLAGGATTFPVPMARGASWNPDLEERIGEAMALEARSFGANWLAAVCINLLRHPGWGRAQETYGEDPLHVGALGAACTRGIQRHAIACVKHLALNSIDSSRFLVDVLVSRRALHEVYLPHFRACIDAGAGSVMSAYKRVNGVWCGEHPELLTVILKQRWGFSGFVVTDFIFGLRDGVASLLAGQDLEMPFRMIFEGCLASAISAGTVPAERLDDAVLRLLRAQLSVPSGTHPTAVRRCAAHRALAREAARQSIVLLRNEAVEGGRPVLPLLDLHSLAVIGPLAAAVNLGDRGSSDTRPPPGAVVTPLQGLQEAQPQLAIEHADGRDGTAAAALAARCEAAVLVLGLDWRLEGEHIHPGDIAPILEQIPPPDWVLGLPLWPRVKPLWRRFTGLLAWVTSYASARQGGDFAAGDRPDLSLPDEQVALIRAVAAANKHTVVVLMGGGAVLTSDWDSAVPGLLLLWYPGEAGGHALAEILFGAASPSGRLPFAIPSDPGQLPPFEPRAPQVTYDLWHGYRRLQRQGQRAAYPFGYGLSYSCFELEAVEVQPLEGSPPTGDGAGVDVRVTVRNAGPMEAAEVVQVYLEAPGVLMERPPRTLVGFQRVELAAAEQRRIHLTIAWRRLACFDERRDGFVLEPGSHQLVVAQHADDPGLSLELAVSEALAQRYWEP
ncbi:MAG: glycoside hydrolase family 3 C-terminal domain-containing protein [Cyanobacteriota bacterium]|nr:glycoside hydrolase family 3 C-terminal domain-containing protein [Cyanobacteriota bacterium]